MNGKVVSVSRVLLVSLSVVVVLFIFSISTLFNNSKKLIPRKVLFGNPDKRSVLLSHDGQYISYLAEHNGAMNVFVAPKDSPLKARAITNDAGRGIEQYLWAYDSDYLVYLQDSGGDEDTHAYSVNIKTGKVLDLTPYPKTKAIFVGSSELFPDDIVIGINNRNAQYHDLYRANIISGTLILLEQNDQFISFGIDKAFNVLFAGKMLGDGSAETYQKQNNGTYKLWMSTAPEDVLTTGIVGYSEDNKLLYLKDSRNRNTSALMEVNLETDEIILLAENLECDVSSLLFDPKTLVAQAVCFEYERKKWVFLDSDVEMHFNYLQTLSKGDIIVNSRTLDDRFWLIAFNNDTSPICYYLYDSSKKQAKYLFSNQESLKKYSLAGMHPVVIKSRDNFNLVSYLTLPLEQQSGNGFVPTTPVPMVIFVHGGPWSSDSWGLNSFHQWLANRGYAVLSVNYRSSTRFGKDFINAGNGQWSKAMHDDLIDAVRWAIDQRIAIPNKVAIAGGSYGGYATLVGLTFTPEVFCCGVDIVGPSNLQTLIETIPTYWKPMKALFHKGVGADETTEEGRNFLAECSPLTYAKKIVKPLLIGQGANDPRVKQSESDQIVAAMQENKIPVSYVLFPDEGHGFVRAENRLAFFAITEHFLASNLGGKTESIVDDFEGSSITIPAGIQHLPGVDKQLKNSNRSVKM